jgi:Lrp/AsnC family transcriptional regulator, leucine-responsive regulatory protein
LTDGFEMDMVDWEIVELLQRDGRVSIAQIGRKLRMAPPSVADRIRRLEKAGVILGYRADIDAQALGLVITAFIRIHIHPTSYDEFFCAVSNAPEVRECFQVAEPNLFQVKVTARDLKHLLRFALKLNGFGDTVTSIVLSTPLKLKVIDRALRQTKT